MISLLICSLEKIILKIQLEYFIVDTLKHLNLKNSSIIF